MSSRYVMVSILILVSYTFTQSACAQGESASAQATAVVLWDLNVQGMQNLQFDEITIGEEKTINLDGTVNGMGSIGNEQRGKFKITTPQSFQLELKNLPTEMQGPEGDNIPIEFFAAWSENEFPEDNELNIFDANNPLSMSSSESMREVYLFIGARVTPDQTQALGDYEVQVTLSITHGVQ